MNSQSFCCPLNLWIVRRGCGGAHLELECSPPWKLRIQLWVGTSSPPFEPLLSFSPPSSLTSDAAALFVGFFFFSIYFYLNSIKSGTPESERDKEQNSYNYYYFIFFPFGSVSNLFPPPSLPVCYSQNERAARLWGIIAEQGSTVYM